jgi:ATP-binding cassette, subfamily A (ABC1), member 3
MSSIPGSRMVEDVVTRYEVPITPDVTLASLFRSLRLGAGSFEYAVERASLESIFLKVIRQHEVEEKELEAPRRSKFNWTERSNL